MEQVRWGIVGYGNMGSQHCGYLFAGEIENATLTAICDTNEDKLKAAKEKFGDAVKTFTDHKEMFASGLVDAVIVATPHYFHPPICIDALNAGINVISEKPIGVYTKQAEELIEVAKKSDKLFGLMFNQRTSPMYIKARQLVQSGALGELKRCVWIITDWYRTQAYYNSGGWRATWAGEGGGVTLNQCPHQLDLWQWIFGMPTKITAQCFEGKYHDIEVEDDVTVFANYANGATGAFITTTGEYPGSNRLEISGDKGRIVIEADKKTGKFTLKFTKLGQGEREWCYTSDNGFGTPPAEFIDEEVDCSDCNIYKPQHKGITQNFTNAILNGEKLIAPGEEGINGLRISNAIFLSSWLGKTVDVPVDGDLFYSMLQEKIKNSTYEKTVVEQTVDISATYGSN